MARSFEKALADWPYTATTSDGGVQVFGKYPDSLYNGRRGIVFGIAVIASLLIGVGGENPGAGWGIVILAFILCFVLGLKVFGRKLDIRIYPDRITLPGWFGRKNYSRQMPIEFRVERHHMALTERGSDTTYRRSIEVVMQYGEKRIPVAAMLEQKMEMARALVIRLQNTCADVDLMKMAAEPAPASSRRGGEFGPVPDIR